MPDQRFESKTSRFAVNLAADATRQMTRSAEAAGAHETGGVLIGRYSEDHLVALVERVTGGGDDARAGPWWFVRGVRGLQSLLDRLWRDRGGYYLGEWHFHPGAAPTPSHQDARQMREIAKSEKYNCPEPILIILGGGRGRPWRLHVEVFQRDGARHPLGLVVRAPGIGGRAQAPTNARAAEASHGGNT